MCPRPAVSEEWSQDLNLSILAPQSKFYLQPRTAVAAEGPGHSTQLSDPDCPTENSFHLHINPSPFFRSGREIKEVCL